MKRADQRSQSIARQLTRSYLLSSVLPVLVLTLVALGSLLLLGFQAGALIRESLQALNTQAEESLRRLGEQYIQTVARDVALQAAIYISAHPDATMEDLQADETFTRLVTQPVGETGYNCLYEAGTGVMRFHPNPALINREMSFLKDQLPSWWAIFEPSLAGTEVSGYYDWLDPDGSIRQKYMTMTPVPVPFHGKTLMVAATTYMATGAGWLTAQRRAVGDRRPGPPDGPTGGGGHTSPAGAAEIRDRPTGHPRDVD
jgi:hypothetical protein